MKARKLEYFFVLGLCIFALGHSSTPAKDFAEAEIAEHQAKRSKAKLSTEQRLEEFARIVDEETEALLSLQKLKKEGVENEVLENQILRKAQDLEVIRKSFEQIAIGGINLEEFSQEDIPKDWQEELTLIVKPLLENLRSLTEKPRLKESLKQDISQQKKAALTASQALQSINRIYPEDEEKSDVVKQLSVIEKKWQQLLTEAERKGELATIELASINGGNNHWFESFKSSFKKFVRERGLTLLIAMITAATIMLFFKGITKCVEHYRVKKKRSANRTAYRIIAYTQRLLALIFVVVGLFLVFFVRGDVLLMAVMSILIFVSALGLRNFIPQFLEESRILLNIGRVREHELVIYNGVPWRVASINIFSKLINPEIKGVVRLPLEDLKSLSSRQISDERWFPSSIGDWVVDDADNLYEVISQGPHSVELQSAQGTNKLVPTADYYAAGYVNLTKSQGMRIASIFSVDYSLQRICLDEVPAIMQKSVQKYLENSDLGTKSISTRVEFQKAGESSLDYIIIVNIGSEAAGHYYRIERYIQQACVKACNEEAWTIPFPQLTLSRAV